MKAASERSQLVAGRRIQKRIALIGPYPPPYGGISVHVKRVLQYLEQEGIGIDFFCETANAGVTEKHRVHNFTGASKLRGLWRMLRRDYDLIHQHSPSPRLRLLLALLGRLEKQVYLHVHGASLKDTVSAPGFTGRLTRRLLRHCHILADNPDIAALARELGARSVSEIDAFLPPAVDQDILDRFEESHGPLFTDADYTICMVGWFEEYHGEDLYGFDTALESVLRLRGRTPSSIKLIAGINGVKSTRVENRVKEFLRDNDLKSDVELIRTPLEEIWPLFIKADLFIRPSRSDGSALSILEADWFETPVVASDCVPRPKRVVTFKTGDVDSLCSTIADMLQVRRLSTTEKLACVANKRFDYPLFTEVYNLKQGGE